MNVVISGASSGIGHFLARRLQGQGHSVWGLARSPAPGSEPFRSSICDVAEWEQVREVAEAIKTEPGWAEINAVIHCAAQQAPIGPTVKIDPAAWGAAIRTNLDGTFHMVRAFHDSLAGREGRHAKVLCFSGGGATKARPNFSAYAASKTAVVRLVENLAAEWDVLPIDINAIAPGAINTAMTRETVRLGPECVGEGEWQLAYHQLECGGHRIEKVIGLVDFLLSDKPDKISGRLLSSQWDTWA